VKRAWVPSGLRGRECRDGSMTEASGGPANARRSCSFIDPRARLSPASRGSCVGICSVLRSEREVGAPRALDYCRTEEEQVRSTRRRPHLVLEARRSPSAQPSASPHDRDVWGSSALIERKICCFAKSPARASASPQTHRECAGSRTPFSEARRRSKRAFFTRAQSAPSVCSTRDRVLNTRRTSPLDRRPVCVARCSSSAVAPPRSEERPRRSTSVHHARLV
jgi:hypothetical protein